MPKRKTPEDYHALATQLGNIIWLGPDLPKNNATKTLWLCLICDHKFQAVYNNLSQGHGCPECAKEKRINTKRYSPDQYHQLAQECNFTWLGPKATSVLEPTGWQCKACNNTWQARHADIRRGKGCPECAKKNRAQKLCKKPAQYHQLAHDRKAEWLGPEVSNTTISTAWQCQTCGNIWQTSYAYLRASIGCPKCSIEKRANLRRISAKQYHRLAHKDNLIWLGPEVLTTVTNTTWRCQVCNCEWQACYHNIRKGTGCPNCKESKGESRIAQILDFLGVAYKRQKWFDKCRNVRPLPFDFYLPDYKTLVEYQGEQHYNLREKGIYSDPQDLKNLQYRDHIKADFAKENGLYLIVIPYTDFNNIESIVIDWLNSLQNKPTRMDKPPKGVKRIYKNKGNWMIATQLTLLDI